MSLPVKKVPADFPFKHSGNPDKYGQSLGGDFAQVQTNFDARAIYNQTQINETLDALASTTDGDSGADNIGATPLTGGVANTVQGILEELKTEIDLDDAQNVKLTGVQTVNGIKTFVSSPIVPVPTTSTQAAQKAQVDAVQSDVNNKDAQNVKLTGNQTISDVKTFNASPVVPTPTTDMQASTKKYVDDGLLLKANDNAVVKLTGNQTIAGEKTFSTSPQVPTPDSVNDATPKTYVDTTAATAITNHEADTTAHPALNITFDKTGTSILSNDTQNALEELDTRLKAAEVINVNVEVTAARTSTAYAQTFATLDDRLEYAENQVKTPTYGTIPLTPTTSVQSVTDSYSGIVDAEIGGATLSQLVVNGDFSNDFTNWTLDGGASDSISATGGIDGGKCLKRTGANGRRRETVATTIGTKYYFGGFIKVVVGSLSYPARISFGGVNLDKGITNGFEQVGGFFTATGITTLLDAGSYFGGQVVEYYFDNIVVIPITGTPYESYTADQLNAMVTEYWEGLKSTEQVELESVGVNLLERFEFGDISVSTGENIDTSLRIRNVGFITVKPNTTYKMSGNLAYTWVYNFYDANKKFITYTVGSSATTPSNCKYIRIRSGVNGENSLSENWMLNEGSTALPYEVYENSILSVNCMNPSKFELSQLPNLVQNEVNQVKGYLSAVKRNELYVVKASDITAYTTTGINADWAVLTKTALVGYKYPTNIPPVDGTINLEGYPEVRVIGQDFTDQHYKVNTASSAGNFLIVLPKNTYPNLLAAQTALAGREILFELATPVFIPYEDFDQYGIVCEGLLTSQDDYTSINYTGDLVPNVELTYPRNIGACVDGLTNSLANLKNEIDVNEANSKSHNIAFKRKLRMGVRI